MEGALQQLMGSEHKVVFVPQDKWPQIRKNYIKEHGLDHRKSAAVKSSGAGQPKPAPSQAPSQSTSQATTAAPAPQQSAPLNAEPPLPEEPPLDEDDGSPAAPQKPQSAGSQDPVTAAKQLFGDDIVKIEDN